LNQQLNSIKYYNSILKFTIEKFNVSDSAEKERSMKYLAAAVQMTSTGDTTGNLERAVGLIKEAASRGATLIGLPENWSMIRDESDEPPAPISFDEGPMGALRALCREKSVTLIAGTVPEAGPDGKVFNSCPVIGPDGEIISVYRKIHLFDVVIRGGEAHRESRHVAPGKDAVIADTSCGKIGLSVCYDLRFPELYRTLARRGARVLSVPAAFTLHTGKDHWVVLIKARAIENLAYVIAPAQIGANTPNRRTFGKSLISDPWGNILATAPDREGVAVAEIDFDFQDALRAQLPALGHIRTWLLSS